DAPVEIARHPVGRTDEHFGQIGGQLVAVAEADNAAMLEKPPDDALDADVFGKPGNAWPQTANAAHHQVDAHPCLRGLVKKVDYGRVDERVHFGPNLCRLALPCVLDLGFDQLAEPGPEPEGCDRHLLETCRARIARHEIE